MGLRGRSNLTEERIFFITTTVKDFVPVFSEDKYSDILIHNIEHYQARYKFDILAYVIMPSHFHWIIINDPKHGTVSDLMGDIKKYSAWDILQELEKSGSIYLKKFYESKK